MFHFFQTQLRPLMEKMTPRPSVYYPDFIAANQADRADNIITGNDKWEHVQKIRADIRDFKNKHNLDKVRKMQFVGKSEF